MAEFCKWRPEGPLLALFLAMALQIAVTLTYALTLHWEFKTSANDIGVFTQALHNLVHGRGLVTTLVPPYVAQHWFAVHFSPALHLLAPLYALWQSEMLLRVANVLLLAAAAIPLYACARRITGNASLAFTIATCYLVSPYVVNAAIWDFHEVSFAPLLFAGGYLAVLAGRKRWFVAICLLLLATKEHYGLAVAGFAGLWGWHHKDWRFALVLMMAGLGVMAAVLGAAMPAVSPDGRHFMVSGEDRRFSLLESGGFFWILADGAVYLGMLGLAWLFLPFAALLWLLPGIADLAVNAVSLKAMMRSPYSYHSAALVVVFAVAAAQGAAGLMRRRPVLKPHDFMAAFAAMALALHWFFAALPYRPDNFWGFTQPLLAPEPRDAEAMRDIRNLIPPTDPIVAQDNAGAHFAQRAGIYHFPEGLGHATWLLLRLDGLHNPATAASCNVQMEHSRAMLQDSAWGLAYWRDPWLVLQKDSADRIAERASVLEALARVRARCKEE